MIPLLNLDDPTAVKDVDGEGIWRQMEQMPGAHETIPACEELLLDGMDPATIQCFANAIYRTTFGHDLPDEINDAYIRAMSWRRDQLLAERK